MQNHRSSINLVEVTREQNWEFSLFFSAVVRQNSPSMTAFDYSKVGGNSHLRDGYRNKRRGTKHFHDRLASLWPSHPYSTMVKQKNPKSFFKRDNLMFFYMCKAVSNKTTKKVFSQLQEQPTAYENSLGVLPRMLATSAINMQPSAILELQSRSIWLTRQSLSCSCYSVKCIISSFSRATMILKGAG